MTGLERSQANKEAELLVAAMIVASYPPEKPQRPTVRVYVPYIERLRDALEALGYDWRKVRT